LKPSAFLINTARAAVINQKALETILSDQKIAGAAIDVYWQEPPQKDSSLFKLPNTLYTPHIGGSTLEVEARTSELVVQRVLEALEN